MQQHILFPDHLEQILRVPHRRTHRRHKRLIPQLGRMVSRAHRHQAHRIERPVDPVNIARIEIEVLHQVLADFLRGGVVHLEAHRRTAPSVVQLLLDSTQQVARVVLVDVKLAIARQTKVPVPENLRPGKKVRKIVADQVAQKHVVALFFGPGQPNQTGQHPGHLHHRQPPASASASGR